MVGDAERGLTCPEALQQIDDGLALGLYVCKARSLYITCSRVDFSDVGRAHGGVVCDVGFRPRASRLHCG